MSDTKLNELIHKDPAHIIHYETNRPCVLYISGKMSGLADHGIPAFDKAQAELEALRYTVISPANNDGRSRDKPWEYYMRLDIQHVANADAIVVMDNWIDSQGAMVEVALATRLGIPVYRLAEVLEKKTITHCEPIKPWIKIESGLQNKDLPGGGTKHDSEKMRLDLIPPSSMRQLAAVLTFGAKKYDDNNWRKGFKWSRVYGAAQRHLLQWFEGQDNDEESGLPHLAHALCNIVFLIEFAKTKPELDDRLKT